MSSVNHYDVLGVDPSATLKDIKRAFRKKAMKHHPDRGGDEEEFKKINEAYEILSSPLERALFDSKLRMEKAEWSERRAEQSGSEPSSPPRRPAQGSVLLSRAWEHRPPRYAQRASATART